LNDTSQKVDDIIKTKSTDFEMERVKDNLEFIDKVESKPVITDVFNEEIFGEIINFNPYIQQQAWPSDIYFIDALIKLNTSAEYDWQKRYLQKKRRVSMKFIWILILLMIIGVVIMVILLFVVPAMQGATGGIM
jgi:hypothetical protein